MDRFLVGSLVVGQGLDAASGPLGPCLLQEVRHYRAIAPLGRRNLIRQGDLVLDLHEQMELVTKPRDDLDDLASGVGVLLAPPRSQRQAVGVPDDFVWRRGLILGGRVRESGRRWGRSRRRALRVPVGLGYL